MATLVLLFTAIATVAEKIQSLFASLALVANSLFDSAKTGFMLLVSGYTLTMANRKFQIIVPLVLVVCGVGVCFVFFTDVAMNGADSFNTCVVRPGAEYILKYFLHPLRWIIEVLFSTWNTVIRYIWSACFSVSLDDIWDWMHYVLDNIKILVSSDGYANISILASIFQVIGRVGNVLMSVTDLPLIFFSLLDCTAHFWTSPRINWAVPTFTSQEPASFHPAFFREHYLVATPTNSPTTPAPTPMPSPTPPPPPIYSFWSDYAYEFNPRYGAFNGFLGGFQSSTSTIGRVANHVRRVFVAIHEAVSNFFRTLAIFIKSFRTSLAMDLWGSLIVSTDSEVSLWRQVADTTSSIISIPIVAFIPSTLPPNQCPGLDAHDEFSNYRFAAQRVVYRIMRRFFDTFRVLSLIFYESTTNRIGGAPAFDFVFAVLNLQTPLNLNLFTRERTFCNTYFGVKYQNFPALASQISNCPVLSGFNVGDCNAVWDGLSYQRFFDSSLNFKVKHFSLLFQAIRFPFYVPLEIVEGFRVTSCGTYTPPAAVAFYIKFMPLVLDLLEVFVVDIPLRLTFLRMVNACVLPINTLQANVLFAKWFIVDYLMNGVIPVTIGTFTGYDCVKGQNLFTCVVTQLAVSDLGPGFFREICQFVHIVTDAIEAVTNIAIRVMQFINEIISKITTEISNLINNLIQGIMVAIEAIAGAISDASDCVKDIGQTIGSWFGLSDDPGGVCNGDGPPIVSIPWPGKISLPNITDVLHPVSLNLLMPCTESELFAANATLGPIRLANLKRYPDREVSWINADGTADIEEFVRVHYGGSTRKRRNSAFDGNSAFNPENMTEQLEAWYKEHSETISMIKYFIYSSDARKFYRNVETCFIGTKTVPSHYSMCTDVQRSFLPANHIETPADSVCIASRCGRVAMQCLRESNQKFARSLSNPDKLNMIQDHIAAKPFFFVGNSALWLTEATTCAAATPHLARSEFSDTADSILKVTLATIGFAWDFMRRVQYMSSHYAFAYYDCLDRTEAWARSVVDPSNAETIERYVGCLESPYMNNETAAWNVPSHLRGKDDSKAIFTAYLHEQGLSKEDADCFDSLSRHGVLFDNSHTIQSSEQLKYRICSYLHAYGTRATLAAHLANMPEETDIKARESHMWSPRVSTMRGYMNLWRAPILIMRSAEFMTISLYDTLERYVSAVGNFVAELFVSLSRLGPVVRRIFRAQLTTGFPTIAAATRLVTYWADIYDEIIDPMDYVDRLVGRSDHIFLEPQRREEVVANWQRAMREDIAMLLSMNNQTGKEDQRRLNLTNYLTYEQFRNTGVKLARRRIEDVTRHEAGYTETYDGIDEDGWESYTILLHNKKFKNVTEYEAPYEPVYVRNTEESMGDIIRNFADSQYQRLAVQLRSEDAYKPLLSRNAFQTRQTRDGRTFDLEILTSRNQYDPSDVRIDVRIVKDPNVIQQEMNLSAAWTYVPFERINLARLSEALHDFVDKATSEETSNEQDINEAIRAAEIIDSVRGSVTSVDAALDVYSSEKFIQDFEKGLVKMPTPWEMHELRRKQFTPVSKKLLGSALAAVINIVDRPMRVADLPPVQALGMYVSAMASQRVDLMSDWLSGTLGYVNGIGFVPRAYYEQYMSDVNTARESQVTPFAFLSSSSSKSLRPYGTTAISRIVTPVFAISHDEHLRGVENVKMMRQRLAQRFARRHEEVQSLRRRNAELHKFIRSGHFAAEFENGDARTFDMYKDLMPHIHNGLWVHQDIDVEELRHIMDTTTPHNRTDAQRELMRRSIITVTGDTRFPTLAEIGHFLDRIIKFFTGKEDVLFNAWTTLETAAGNLVDMFDANILWMEFKSWLSSGACVAPDDYALDGTGTFSWACFFSWYLPERIMSDFDVWPTNAHNGDIHWPDEAYAGGVAVNCDGTTMNTPANYFTPDFYCDSTNFVPIYEDWKNTKFCIATRTGGKARQCISAGAEFGSTSTYPACPQCEFCVKQYKSCVDLQYGIDPIRVLQVYTHHLGIVWAEVFDVTNNLFSLLVFMILFEFTTSSGILGLITLVPTLLMLFYGLLFSSQSWLYPSVFAAALLFLWAPGAWLFYVYMLFRYIWYQNPVTANAIFASSLGADPFGLPYYDPMQAIGKLVRWFSELSVPWFVSNTVLADLFPWLTAVADEFSLFTNGGAPTEFENMCSAFGIWTVVALALALLALAVLFMVFGSLIVSLAALALAAAMLVFTVGGYMLLIGVTGLIALWTLTRYGGNYVDYKVDSVKDTVEDLGEETEQLRRRQTKLENEVRDALAPMRDEAKKRTPTAELFIEPVKAERRKVESRIPFDFSDV